MKTPNIRFAFAVNKEESFELKHFGDADKYLIYEFLEGEFKLITEQQNTLKLLDESPNHGSKDKGNSIIKLLKENKVNVLVSRQFGPNVKKKNQHFVPIIIHDGQLSVIRDVLAERINWIEDELENNNKGYKLFSINKGILKRPIKSLA